MGFFKKRAPDIRATDSEMGEFPAEDNPTIDPASTSLRPMQSYNGLVTANPQMFTPNRDQEYDATPIVFNRFATRWGDMQLKNGLANGVASGKIWGYRGEGWYDNVVPTIPGQTRLIGGNHPGFFPAKGPAPSQWQNAYNQTAGSQPQYPGGPGQVLSNQLDNPGTGG